LDQKIYVIEYDKNICIIWSMVASAFGTWLGEPGFKSCTAVSNFGLDYSKWILVTQRYE